MLPWLRRAAIPAGLGGLIVLLFFGKLLVPGHALAVRDVPMFHLPLRLDWSLLARHGMPFWNPAVNGGQPILSNPNYASFYPPTWLSLAMPAHYAMSAIALLHAGWAFAGAWLLARRLGGRVSVRALAAVGFVASSAFVATIYNFTLFCGLSWLPWVMYWGELALRGPDRSERTRGVVLAGLAIGAQILSGEPYSPILGVLALFCSTLGGGGRITARLCRAVLPMVLGTAIGAVQLIPTALHVADSPRAAGLTGSAVEQTLTWSTRPNRVVEWVFPHLRGNPTQVDRGLFFGSMHHDRRSAYLPSIYVGLLALVLAITALSGTGARHRAVWIAMVVAGVSLAVGRHNPLYAKVLVHVPPWSLLRYPEKFMVLATTGLTFAAAMGWEDILTQRDRGVLRPARRAGYVSLALTAMAAGLFVLPFVRPELARALVAGGAQGEPITNDEAARLGLLGFESVVTLSMGLASFAAMLLHRSVRVRERWLGIAVLTLLGVDLYRVGRGYVETALVRDLYMPPAEMASLPVPSARVWTDHIFARVDTPQPFDFETKGSLSVNMALQRDHLIPYWGNLYGFTYALNGDPDKMLTSPARRAQEIFRNETMLFERGMNEISLRYLGAWNACNLVRRRNPDALLEEYRRTGNPPRRAVVLANAHCLDRLRFVPRARIHADATAAVAAARQQDFNLGWSEQLIGDDENAPTGAADMTRAYAETVAIHRVEDRGARIDLLYEAPGPALLVAAMTRDRNWRASIGGEPAPLLETAIGQMAIEVPAGSHRVTLRYRDDSVFAGGAVSLVSLAAALGLLRRRRA